jgi:RNA polymerase sigma-70 factor (ECF subfamily)
MKEKPLDAKELFIINKMMGGDMEAFKYFFDTYYSDLCNFVNFYIKDEAAAEEIVQDIFVHFWENRERLSVNSSVKSYLYSATKYRGLNLIRDNKRRSEILSSLSSDDKIEIDNGNFDSDVLRDVLSKAMDHLPQKCREISN